MVIPITEFDTSLYLLTNPVYLENSSEGSSRKARWKDPRNRGWCTGRRGQEPSKSGKLSGLLDREDEQNVSHLVEGLVQPALVLRWGAPHASGLGQRHVLRVVALDDEESSVTKEVVQLCCIVIRFTLFLFASQTYCR